MRRSVLGAFLAFPLLIGASHAQTTPSRIRGTIVSLEGDKLAVMARDGSPLVVMLTPNYTVGAIVPAKLDSIKPGSTIGVVGFGPPSKQRAAVISIFPPGASITESQFAWDSEPDSVMTNAPVTSQVASANGRTLMVTVRGEPVEVDVPENAIVQTSQPGTPAMLVAGAKVLVSAQRGVDGSLTASRVNVGKDGFTPAN